MNIVTLYIIGIIAALIIIRKNAKNDGFATNLSMSFGWPMALIAYIIWKIVSTIENYMKDKNDNSLKKQRKQKLSKIVATQHKQRKFSRKNS